MASKDEIGDALDASNRSVDNLYLRQLMKRVTALETAIVALGPFADDIFRIVDNADQSKKLAFEVSGVTTATTRTWTVPDSNVTVSAFAATFLDDTTAAAVLATLGAFGTVRPQIFLASGTYTPHANMVFCLIRLVAAGGGGGGAITSTAGHVNGAGGGGAGASSELWASRATIGASQTVTIGAAGAAGAAGNNNGGAGGSTSVGTLCTANGGAGGGGAAASALGAGGAGGAAGTGSPAIVGATGESGQRATVATVILSAGGGGGSTPFGGGAPAVSANNNGAAGAGYGSGGSGGTDYSATGNKSGGAGTQGIVIIWEFCSS